MSIDPPPAGTKCARAESSSFSKRFGVRVGMRRGSHSMQRLWNDIRARNLHRGAAGYAVVAWILVQIASILLPAFALPQWTLRLLIILLFAAFPVLLIALWFGHPAIE